MTDQPIPIHLPQSVYERLKRAAEQVALSPEDVLAQSISLALRGYTVFAESVPIVLASAEKVSALKTEQYLTERAARGDRARFEAAMSKVADVEPEDYDRL